MPVVKSVRKALDLLDMIVLASLDREGMGLSEIAEELGEQATTVRNILKTMEACGYVSRNGRLYIPGPKCGDLTFGAVACRRLAEIAAPLLRVLAAETGESLVFTVLIHGERKVLLRVVGGETINVNPEHMSEADGYALVTTRVLLATAPAAKADAAIARLGLPGRSWNGIRSRKQLDAALAGLRRAGHAEAVTDSGIVALAVPVDLDSETGTAALGMYMPEFRTNARRKKDLLRQLKSAAQQIKDLLS